MRNGEEDRVFNPVKTGFDEFVLPDVTQEGEAEFYRAACEMICNRPAGHLIIVAELQDVVVGMIDVRTDGHICLFFVAGPFQRRGIGKGLLGTAIAECAASDPEFSGWTYILLIGAYKKLGFIQTRPEQIAHGIRFVPMAKALTERGR